MFVGVKLTCGALNHVNVDDIKAWRKATICREGKQVGREGEAKDVEAAALGLVIELCSRCGADLLF